MRDLSRRAQGEWPRCRACPRGPRGCILIPSPPLLVLGPGVKSTKHKVTTWGEQFSGIWDVVILPRLPGPHGDPALPQTLPAPDSLEPTFRLRLGGGLLCPDHASGISLWPLVPECFHCAQWFEDQPWCAVGRSFSWLSNVPLGGRAPPAHPPTDGRWRGLRRLLLGLELLWLSAHASGGTVFSFPGTYLGVGVPGPR